VCMVSVLHGRTGPRLGREVGPSGNVDAEACIRVGAYLSKEAGPGGDVGTKPHVRTRLHLVGR
jgi:hypothetical protein